MGGPSLDNLGRSPENRVRSDDGRPDRSPGMGGLSPEYRSRSPELCSPSPDRRGPSPSPEILVFVNLGGRQRGENMPTSAAALEVGDKLLLRCSRADSEGNSEDDSATMGIEGGEKGLGGSPSEDLRGCSPARAAAAAAAAAALAEIAAPGEDGRVGQGSGPLEE